MCMIPSQELSPGSEREKRNTSSVPWSTISGVPQRIMTEKSGWSGRELGYDRTKVRTYTTEARLREDGSAELVTELSLSAVHIQRILNIKASWLIHRDGCIQVKLDVKKEYGICISATFFFGLRLLPGSES